jgi:AcrR family transcriptional regulator
VNPSDSEPEKPSDDEPAKPGLRERKKQLTRETIVRVALGLFAERGYDETTLAEIADAANVAPRTIFAYFESKEEILFSEEPRVLAELKRRLDARPAGTTTVDAIREFTFSMEPSTADAKLRKSIIQATPALQMKLRARHAQLEPILAESIARDLDAEPGDIRALLVAASIAAAFKWLSDRVLDPAPADAPLTRKDGMAMLDQVLDFLRGGLEAMRR